MTTSDHRSRHPQHRHVWVYLLVAALVVGWIAVRTQITADRQERESHQAVQFAADTQHCLTHLVEALRERAAITDTADRFNNDQHRVLPVSTLQTGAFDIADVCLSLPTVVSGRGTGTVFEVPLSVPELLGLQGRKDLHLVDKLSSTQTETVEVLISPGCRMEGRRLGELRLRRRYGVYVLAAHRRNQNIGRQLDDLTVRVGDTLLLEGSVEDIQRLAADMDLVDITRPSIKPFRRAKAPIAIAALASVVILSALDVAPIMALALLAVALILITRCVDADEAFTFVDGRLMAMIFAMLAVGEGLDQSGAVEMIVTAVAPHMAGLSPFFLILAVYFLGLILTEFLSNNAVAVIYTPIAIELAQQLGVDPRGFVVAVMFSASVAFATPVGYQTNMMVYGPGGYRFSDFMRVGIPLNILTGLVASALIPVIWPL